MLTREEVDHVADLARLHVDESEYDLYAKQLYDILAEVDKIEKVDLKGEEDSPCELTNVYSSDQVGPMLSHDEIFRNVKHSNGDYIVVPRVVADSEEV